MGLSDLPYGLQQGNVTFDYLTQIRDHADAILVGLENLSNHEVLINDIIKAAQQADDDDRCPPDSTVL